MSHFGMFPGDCSTLAGSTSSGFSDGLGTAASFSNLFGVVANSAGIVYVVDHNSLWIRRVTPLGQVTTLELRAGDALAQPTGIALDSSGNILVAEFGGNRISKITGAKYSRIDHSPLFWFSLSCFLLLLQFQVHPAITPRTTPLECTTTVPQPAPRECRLVLLAPRDMWWVASARRVRGRT